MRARTVSVIAERGVGDGVICEMVLRHELQHSETMRQTMAIAGLLPARSRRCERAAGERRARGLARASRAGRSRWARGAEGFAYDNERPRHTVELAAFALARRPVATRSWMHFSEGGGYERREWWSDEGWAWKEEHDITHHPAVAAGHPEAPACHVSWFEADAFARAHDARLPDRGRVGEGGDLEPGGLTHGLAAVGRVWEWTASRFGGYPGFVAVPLPRVLAGVLRRRLPRAARRLVGDPARVATPRFRNWDLPQRRQIFAGVRLARERVMEPIGTPPQPLAEPAIRIDSHLDGTHERSLADDVLDGLTRPFKELPPKHFYDARGAELFDRICELPEYYPTRAERAILEEQRRASWRS